MTIRDARLHRWAGPRSRWAGAVASAALLFTTATATAPAASAASLPTVDMARVEVAAQVEPSCGNASALADDASTRLVQKALSARGYATTADGWFGNGTTSSFAAWQRHLGYRGIDANGLPGVSSLTSLGSGRFTVADKVSVGSRTDNYRGVRVNTRTKKMLQAADDILTGWNFSLVQGSYRYPNGADASKGTHDGGGIVDVSVAGLSSAQKWQEVKALRTVGFAAWLRTPAQGFSYHIHAVAIGDPDIWQGPPYTASHTNRNQVCDYFRGRNGLSGGGADNTPTSYRVPFTWWERYQ